MSAYEDPAITVMRLLNSQMHVVLDSGALAAVEVSGEWQNSDALKLGDGQVTVALAESVDQKLDLTGKTRQRTSALRVNVWTTDKPGASEGGRSLRNKIVEEVNRIIRQNRRSPNDTVYNYVGQSSNGQGSKAFRGGSEAAPSDEWTELSNSDYEKLWYSDDNRCQTSTNEDGKHAVLLFGFKLQCHKAVVKQAFFSFEGYGSASGGDGVTVKAWNHVMGAWQNPQSNMAAEADEALTLALSASLIDFVDADGYLWFLAETVGVSDGVDPATLHCDQATCRVQVNGVTYCDIAGYRNLDRADIKPQVYRTEFTVKSWLIENIDV